MKRNAKLQAEGPSVFSVDVEDWFHAIPTEPGQNLADWDALPSRVVANFREMLVLFAKRKIRVTCFFLGWIAERHPELVREAAAQGHEIACHGYSHRLVYQMSPEGFLADLRKSKQIIEEIAGTAVLGYRAPAFSVTADTPWFFDALAEAGYKFDASVFPGRRRWGGMEGSDLRPSIVESSGGPIAEFPVTMARIAGRPTCLFGGGYLRLAPYPLIKRMGAQVLREGRPLLFYIHPREIDPGHPRLPMPLVSRFKSYVNLASTRAKLEKILDDFSFTTFGEMIADNKTQRAAATQ